jgi:hypothetical protein
MNVFDFALVVGVTGISVIGGLMYAMSRRKVCPSCGKRGLAIDVRHHAGGIELFSGGRLYRCTACETELVRHHDRGPFVPRALWDTGARDIVPAARVVRRDLD